MRRERGAVKTLPAVPAAPPQKRFLRAETDLESGSVGSTGGSGTLLPL